MAKSFHEEGEHWSANRRSNRKAEPIFGGRVPLGKRRGNAACRLPRNALQGVALGLSFLAERQIDLMKRLGLGLFLTRDELAALADRCLRRVDGRGAVVRQYAKTRYQAFLLYLEWRFEAVLHRAGRDDLKLLKLDFDQFQKRSKAQKPKGRTGAPERRRVGLTSSQRELLLEITDPDSRRNPFKKKLRKRNRALILLHYLLGLRAGELAGI